MSPIISGAMFSVLLFGLLLVAIEAGRRIRLRANARSAANITGLGTIESAVFGLMALILAFAFNGAASRFESRRHLVVAEVNSIGTAYKRLDLLAPADRHALQQRFMDYADARIALYAAVPDTRQVNELNTRAVAIADDIWRLAVAAVASAPTPTVAAQVLPAIGDMVDSATERGAAAFIHPPSIVYVMLCLLSVLAAMLAGYAMGASEGRSWLHMIGFAAAVAITTYVIIDLEYPRLGHFRISDFDKMLVDWRATITTP